MREEYKQQIMGKKHITFAKLTNSDLIYNNVFLKEMNANPFRNQLYTGQKR